MDALYAYAYTLLLYADTENHAKITMNDSSPLLKFA